MSDETRIGRFSSILFDRPESAAEGVLFAAPDSLADLHLDENEGIVAEFFTTPLRTVAAVQYRHDVFRDLARDEIRAPFDEFAAGMAEMRSQLAQADKLYHQYQVVRWHLDAVDTYCRTVLTLQDELASSELSSHGLRAFTDFLTEYVTGQYFTRLIEVTDGLLDELGTVRYVVHVDGQQVQVDRYEDQADYTGEVGATFERFDQPDRMFDQQGRFGWAGMNQVEERVLDCVAALYPGTFRKLDSFRSHYRDFVDSTIEQFDHEVQFYLRYLTFIRPFDESGLSFCYPELTDQFDGIEVEDAFDVALAQRLGPTAHIVCNDFSLSGTERVLVVTGPNQSGKTAFARTVGQVAYLAAHGCPVPARRARMMLPDRLFTNFERKESLATLHGKLDEELARVHDILAQASPRSVIVMNESFSSTTVSDALLIGSEVLHRIITLKSIAVYVTFLDELARLGPACVSVAGVVDEDDPTRRTFKFTRRPADGMAFAEAFAARYGLTYEALSRRVGAR